MTDELVRHSTIPSLGCARAAPEGGPRRQALTIIISRRCGARWPPVRYWAILSVERSRSVLGARWALL